MKQIIRNIISALIIISVFISVFFVGLYLYLHPEPIQEDPCVIITVNEGDNIEECERYGCDGCSSCSSCSFTGRLSEILDFGNMNCSVSTTGVKIRVWRWKYCFEK